MQSSTVDPATPDVPANTAARPRRRPRFWSAGFYAAVFLFLALPFATLYTACSHQRIDTINGYQVLAPHSYMLPDGDSIKVVSIGTDGFGWIAIALIAIGIALSLIGVRTVWLAAASVVGVVALFLMVTAAGGSSASSKAEIGFWLSALSVAAAPAGDVRPWRRALLVALATALAAAALVGILIGLIALTAKRSQAT